VAQGDILAFTDDDVIVDPFWLDAIRIAAMADPAIALIGGQVAPLGTARRSGCAQPWKATAG
jgi:GT2 family glycosyltransferase